MGVLEQPFHSFLQYNINWSIYSILRWRVQAQVSGEVLINTTYKGYSTQLFYEGTILPLKPSGIPTFTLNISLT